MNNIIKRLLSRHRKDNLSLDNVKSDKGLILFSDHNIVELEYAGIYYVSDIGGYIIYAQDGESHEELISRVSTTLGEDLAKSNIRYTLFHGIDLIPALSDRETELIISYLTRSN